MHKETNRIIIFDTNYVWEQLTLISVNFLFSHVRKNHFCYNSLLMSFRYDHITPLNSSRSAASTKRERVGEREKVNQREKERNPNQQSERPIRILSTMGFDSASSSSLVLLKNKSFRKKTEKGKIKIKIFNLSVKKIKTISFSKVTHLLDFKSFVGQ